MADRDRFGGSERDYLPVGKAAHVGAQYAGASRDFYGGPSKGSPMIDIRYENYQAPHRVDYNRNVPRQTGTPNFRPPYGAPGQPSYNEWQQQIDPFHTGPYPPKTHPNPRMRGRGRGMGGGLGGLQEQAAVDPSDWRTIIKILEAGGDPGTETQTAQIERNWDSMPDLADWKQGIGPGARKPVQTIPIFPGTFGDSLEEIINDQTLGNQWAEIAEADTGIGSTNEYQTAGLWQDWKRIFKRTGNAELADFWMESQRAV